MCWYYILIAAYVAMELSIGAWMMEYLQQQYQYSVDSSSRYLSAFFVLLMLGRLVGAWLVERLDYLWAVGLAMLFSGLCIAGGLLVDARLAIDHPYRR